jgi:hypothetical protein
VIKLMTHIKETGSVVPKKIGGYRKPMLAPHDSIGRELAEATPDATLDEFVVAVSARAIATSRSTLDCYFRRIGWSFKKLCTQPSKTGPTSKPLADSGASNSLHSILILSFASKRRALPPIWCGVQAALPLVKGYWPKRCMVIGAPRLSL